MKGVLVALGLALASGCGSGSDAPVGGGDVTQHPPSQGGSGGAPAPSEPDSGAAPSTPSDAGPYQSYPRFDGSTTPTANYAQGVDAAAAEDSRGFAEQPDAGPDAQ